MPDLISPVEMYLKAILEMQESEVPKRRVRIAQRLEQSGPTVTNTVRRMERDDLIAFSDENKKLEFTPRGFQQAMSVMRKHRLAECFLEGVVGLDWTLLHDEACRWEHVMSDQVADRIDDLLHHPQHTPYGNPIPARDAAAWNPLGDHPEVSNLVRFLRDTDSMRRAQIAWIGEALQTSPQQLELLRDAGAMPGETVEFSLHGPSVLLHRSGSQGITELQHSVAVELFVRESPER